MQHPQQLTDRYQILDILGQGGMGIVYRAVHRSSSETVAIKALRFECAPDPALVERFLREGEALRRLSHPNIVKCRESFEAAGHFYLVLDYVPGGSLRQLLQSQGRLEASQAVEIMLDVADALTRAHRLQIVHRDVKPDNILVANDGHAHLTDFGVAYLGSAWTPLTMDGTALGTVAYMSPEACRGEAASPGLDIWAFGATLFELLTGQVPFGGPGPGQIILAILSGPLPDMVRAEIPGELVSLLSRLLERDPAARLASMREVGLELERACGQLSPSPAPARVSAPAPEPSPTDTLPGYSIELKQAEVLWHQGDPSDFVAYLEEGELEVVGTSIEGSTVVFTVLRPGEVLGEMSCLDGQQHSATVRARLPCRIRKLGRNEFLSWIRSDPERMQGLLMKQSERLRRVAGRLMHSQDSLPRRLAWRLLECPENVVTLTRQQLADELGVQRDSLSRALRELARQGLVRVSRSRLEIVDRSRLGSL